MIYIAPLLTHSASDNYNFVPPEQFLGDQDYANFWMAYRQNTLEYFEPLNRYSSYEIFMNDLVDCDQGFPGLCFDILEGKFNITYNNNSLKHIKLYYSNGVHHTSQS